MEFIFDGVKYIVGKGENAGYQHFLLFPLCFKMPPMLGCRAFFVGYFPFIYRHYRLPI